jgi:hypothetical protein
MTPTQALAMLTGPRSISDTKTSILGDGDMLALQTLLEAYKSQRAALAGLIGPSAAVLDDYSSLLDAGILEGDDDRESTAHAYADDLAMAIGKADQALGEDA